MWRDAKVGWEFCPVFVRKKNCGIRLRKRNRTFAWEGQESDLSERGKVESGDKHLPLGEGQVSKGNNEYDKQITKASKTK